MKFVLKRGMIMYRWKPFEKYLAALTKSFKHHFSLALPARFVLVFKKQTRPDAHYVAAFPTITSGNAAEYHTACLEMFQLENETTQGAEKHVYFPQFYFPVFGTVVSNLID